jgi:hypothetical protein
MTPDRRKQPKIDPLGTRGSDFAVRVLIYIAVIVIATIIKLASGH